MAKRDHSDALMDHLLREELGGDRPRDLVLRVMAMARAYDRRRRIWWIGAASGIAAAIAITLTLFALWPASYPKPAATGDFVVSGGGTLQRGATIETHGAATLDLGGYVNAAVDPRTKLTLGGDKFEEKLLLDAGGVACKIEKNRGHFDVLVGPADVHVTGTKFTVKVKDETRDGRPGRLMQVSVESGEVIVDGVPGRKPMTLSASKRESFFIPNDSAAMPAPKPKPATTTTRPSTTRKREPEHAATTRPAANTPAPPSS